MDNKPKFEDQPANFRNKDGKEFLVRCPACEKENYSPSVATGQCAWCGWKSK